MTFVPVEMRSASRDGTPSGSVPKLDPRLGLDLGRVLLCRACDAPVTSEALSIAIEGRVLHRRVNPAGVEFEFMCFADAPGAGSTGGATLEYSWFPGYAWSYALCRSCLAHLGWFFEGPSPSFFGLVVEKLRSEDDA